MAQHLRHYTREWPWQLAQHFAAALTKGASDASSVAWEAVGYVLYLEGGDVFILY